jgi:hypothetical protein
MFEKCLQAVGVEFLLTIHSIVHPESKLIPDKVPWA